MAPLPHRLSTAARTPHSWLWGRYMRVYDRLARHSIAYQTMQSEVKRAVALPRTGTGIDIGCATGNTTLHLTGDHRMTHAVDSCPAAIEQARQKCEARGVPGVVFHCQDAFDFLRTIEPDSIDRVTAVNVLYTMASAQQVLEEIHRVLIPGQGRFVAVDLLPGFDSKQILWANIRWRWDANMFLPALTWTLHDLALSQSLLWYNRLIMRLAAQGEFTYRSQEEFKALLTGIGFSSVNSKNVYANQSALYVADKPVEIE